MKTISYHVLHPFSPPENIKNQNAKINPSTEFILSEVEGLRIDPEYNRRVKMTN